MGSWPCAEIERIGTVAEQEVINIKKLHQSIVLESLNSDLVLRVWHLVYETVFRGGISSTVGDSATEPQREHQGSYAEKAVDVMVAASNVTRGSNSWMAGFQKGNSEQIDSRVLSKPPPKNA